MSPNPTTSSGSPNERSWPNQSFYNWLKTQTALYIGSIVAWLTLPSIVIAMAYYSPHLVEGVTVKVIQRVLVWLHVPFLLLFLIKFMLILDKNDIGAYRANMVYKRVFKQRKESRKLKADIRSSKIQIRKFKTNFICFIVSLLALYLIFGVTAAIKPDKEAALANDTLRLQYKHIDSTRMDSTAIVLANEGIQRDGIKMKLEHTIYRDTLRLQGWKMKKDSTIKVKDSAIALGDTSVFLRSQKLTNDSVKHFTLEQSVIRATLQSYNPWAAFVKMLPEFIPFAVNTLSIIFIFSCFGLLYAPGRDPESKKTRQLMIRGCVFIVSCIITLFVLIVAVYRHWYFDEHLVGYIALFYSVSGVLNAIALSLLIGRLDSKLIGLPSLLVCFLYVYAAVQPLFAVFEIPMFVNEIIKTAVFVIVFFFKIYFFFIIIYVLQTGRLLNYFFCFPELNKTVDSIFQNQFEITLLKEHAHHFSFNIMKGSKFYFTSDMIFESRYKCLKAIKMLRRITKNADLIMICKSDGTYWLELRDSEGKVYCNSLNLRTREEADELKERVVQFVPYCKLNYT